MSDKKTQALALVRQLKEKAAAGDPQAKVKLDNLSATVMGLKAKKTNPHSAHEKQILNMADMGLFDVLFDTPGMDEAAPLDTGELDEMDHASQTAQAAGGVNTLEGKVALRDQRQQNLIADAPFARINPPSVLKGNLGNQQNMTVGDNPKDVAFWVGADDAESLPVTCTFASTQLSLTPNNGIAGHIPAAIRPYGIIRFGTRGFVGVAEVDILAGVQNTISGNNVTLQVALDTNEGVFIPGSGSTLVQVKPGDNGAVAVWDIATNTQLFGELSFYPIVRTAPLTRTRYIDNWDPTTPQGALLYVGIPRFAKRLFILRNNAGGVGTEAAFSFWFIDNTLILTTRWDVLVGAQMAEAVDIPGDAAFVLVRNNSGATIDSMRLIFELGI